MSYTWWYTNPQSWGAWWGEWGEITWTLSNQTDLQSALDAKEWTISAGTTSQYWRGDKSWQTLNKSAVWLWNVDNTSDATKNAASATLTNKTVESGIYSNDFTVTRTGTAIDANSAAEMIIWVTDTSVARTITLDTDDVVAGRIKIIKDESWAAATNNITIATEWSETIDWASTITITANYWVARVYSDWTNWFTF